LEEGKGNEAEKAALEEKFKEYEMTRTNMNFEKTLIQE